MIRTHPRIRNRKGLAFPGPVRTSLSPVKKLRLDEILVTRELAPSRAKAQALILAGKVRHGTERLDKAGKTYPEDIRIEIEEPPRFVSRGGEKLAAFLAAFPIPVEGIRFLDVGASTGGFTDCLLQAGAATAVCVDVGHGQLHFKLREDPRVHNFEKINARAIDPGILPFPDYPLVVMDLSFISLRKILPACWPLLQPDGTCIALVKPQFEATREEANAGHGIITDDTVRERILSEIESFAISALDGATVIHRMECPVHGTDGNREYLLGLRRVHR